MYIIYIVHKETKYIYKLWEKENTNPENKSK